MIIYKTTNLKNGKVYIGQDSKNNPNYFGSGLNLERAIKKHGIENFKKEIIETCENKETLNEREIFWINFYNSTDPKTGYNISKGGQGGVLCDVEKLKGENHYLNKMSFEEREKHLNEFRRGLNYWKSKGFTTIEQIEKWIEQNWTGKNHSHKKNKSEDEYKSWLEQTKKSYNFIRPDLTGDERKEYFKKVLGGKNNPIFRGKTDEEIEDWLNKHRRGENCPNAKYEYEIITNEGVLYNTKSLKTFCRENSYNYMVLYFLEKNPKRIPKKKEYRGWKVTKKNRKDK